MIDSSNESLLHADEELGPNLRIGSPLQTFFQKVDVPNTGHNECEADILFWMIFYDSIWY